METSNLCEPLDPGRYMRGIDATLKQMDPVDRLNFLDEMLQLLKARMEVLREDLDMMGRL